MPKLERWERAGLTEEQRDIIEAVCLRNAALGVPVSPEVLAEALQRKSARELLDMAWEAVQRTKAKI